MNVVALVGNVASKPEMRETSSGRACCTFRLAVSRIAGDQADFLTVVAWERQAEVCEQFIDIGRRIGLEGRLRHSTWKADDGTNRGRVEVIANRVELLGPRSNRDRSDSAPTQPSDSDTSTGAVNTAASDHDEHTEHDVVFGLDPVQSSSVFDRVPEPV